MAVTVANFPVSFNEDSSQICRDAGHAVLPVGQGDSLSTMQCVIIDGNRNIRFVPRAPATPLRRAKTAATSLRPSSRVQSAWQGPNSDHVLKEPAMDVNQRSVMRRWRPILAEKVHVRDEMIDEMQDAGLLTEDNVKFVKIERINKVKLYRIIDAIQSSKATAAFDKMCQVLSKFYPDLAQSIVSDLEIERGHLTVDPALKQEAETLVHRRFGGNKRFCELDKKDIADLFAWKMQVLLMERKQERERLVEALKTEKQKGRVASQRCAEMSQMLDTFYARHRKHIVTHAHDMQTPGEVVTMSDNDVHKACTEKLQEKLKRLIERIDMMVMQNEKLHVERQQCFSYMKVPSNENVRLDTALSRFVAEALGKLEAEIEEKEAELIRLNLKHNVTSQ